MQILYLLLIALPLATCLNETACTRPDIEQFPKSFFNQEQRQHGAVLFHLFIAIYMFIALSIVCDNYFVPSLEEIGRVLYLKEDVAGATLMAVGSSVPELATTLIALFVAKDVDIGIGTVVGSAVFNVLIVIGVISCFSGVAVIKLNWFPLARDSFFYLISILSLILIIMDGKVYWYEACVLLVLYVIYIIFMFFSAKIEKFIKDKIQSNPVEIIDLSEIGIYDTFEDELKSNLNQNLLLFTYPSDSSLFTRILFVINFPLNVILHLTIPKANTHVFILTFIMCLIWLSVFSYVMVWTITVIGYTYAIPDTIMGITFIAFGASVEDVLSSLNVAKRGLGDMAVSNAIGSNVFDVLVCLGLPWLLSCSLVNRNGYVVVKNSSLTYSSLTLFGTVLILLISISLNKWKLDKKLGILYFIIYLLFIGLVSLNEFNNGLKMCLNSVW